MLRMVWPRSDCDGESTPTGHSCFTAPLSMPRAWLRYLLCWLWFAPALLWLWLQGASSLAPDLATLTAGVLIYAALARMLPGRQFWHDVVCGTRLVDVSSAQAASTHG